MTTTIDRRGYPAPRSAAWNTPARSRPWLAALLAAALVAAAGCANRPGRPAAPDAAGPAAPDSAAALLQQAAATPDVAAPMVQETAPAAPPYEGFVQRGTGRFTNSGRAAGGGGWEASSAGDITLSFQSADLREVVKVVLGDILGANYLISEKVRGQITLHTETPVGRDALLPILESALQMNGAALVVSESGYRILPESEAAALGLRPAGVLPGGAGYRLRIVPLRYVSATALVKVLEPFVPPGANLRIDTANNLLLLAGPARPLEDFAATVKLFDADWLAGMSFGMYPLQQAEAQQLVDDLQKVFGLDTDGPLTGVLRLVPIERLNSVLVISKRPEYLDRVAAMITRFDRGGGGAGRSLSVYYLKHGQAAALAGVLGELFADRLAGGAGGFAGAPATGATADGDGGVPTAAPAAFGAGGGGEGAQIIADEANNALLVMATPAEYRVIERAMRKLDVPRRQVLVEATIAEVTLTDNLQYGLRWFLQSRPGARNLFGRDFTNTANLNASSFNYTLTRSIGGALSVQLLFDLIASESKVKVLSSPQVLVVDNQTANIRVGTQIPIITRSAQSTDTPDAPIIAEVQYRDTGVLLQVTPRINEGGMVTLEISQEVSQPTVEVAGDSNVPISQRSVTSVVTVPSGETVLLGGLISENKTDSVSGIPGLSQVPVVGKLFSDTSDRTTRTELLVTITPTVINSGAEAREATEELRQRMRQLETGLEPIELNLLPRDSIRPDRDGR